MSLFAKRQGPSVEKYKREILEIIDQSGFYLTPPNILKQRPYTDLHAALAHLKKYRIIIAVEPDEKTNFDRWVRR